MYEICVQQMFDAIQGAQTGTPPGRVGNYSTETFWQAVLPAAGEDRWVAVTVADQREWQLLLALAGNTDLAGWSAKIPDQVLADLLQAQGIAAGVVQDIEDLMSETQGCMHAEFSLSWIMPAWAALDMCAHPSSFRSIDPNPSALLRLASIRATSCSGSEASSSNVSPRYRSQECFHE